MHTECTFRCNFCLPVVFTTYAVVTFWRCKCYSNNGNSCGGLKLISADDAAATWDVITSECCGHPRRYDPHTYALIGSIKFARFFVIPFKLLSCPLALLLTHTYTHSAHAHRWITRVSVWQISELPLLLLVNYTHITVSFSERWLVLLNHPQHKSRQSSSNDLSSEQVIEHSTLLDNSTIFQIVLWRQMIVGWPYRVLSSNQAAIVFVQPNLLPISISFFKSHTTVLFDFVSTIMYMECHLFTELNGG